jgi:RNA polymerase sigma-70 factor (family 1)
MSANEDQAVPSDNLDLKELFDRYYTRLVYFSAQIVGSKEAAEDIAQDAFIKCWSQREDIEKHELAIKSYLYSTVKHASLNAVRHQKVKADYAMHVSHRSVTEESLDETIIFSEVLAELHTALDTLPERCQRISKMGYLEEMKNGEIAEELGISVNTVKTQKQRALQLLRLMLKPGLSTFLLLMNL